MTNHEKIISRLEQYEKKISELAELHHSDGNDDYYELKKKVRMIIRRTFPNSEEVEDQLFSGVFIGSLNPTDGQKQRRYENNLEELRKAINVLLEEYELFGFDKFEPVSEETEDELQLGIGNSHWKRTKRKK